MIKQAQNKVLLRGIFTQRGLRFEQHRKLQNNVDYYNISCIPNQICFFVALWGSVGSHLLTVKEQSVFDRTIDQKTEKKQEKHFSLIFG